MCLRAFVRACVCAFAQKCARWKGPCLPQFPQPEAPTEPRPRRPFQPVSPVRRFHSVMLELALAQPAGAEALHHGLGPDTNPMIAGPGPHQHPLLAGIRPHCAGLGSSLGPTRPRIRDGQARLPGRAQRSVPRVRGTYARWPEKRVASCRCACKSYIAGEKELHVR